jgi:hypothetical protein
MKKCQKRVLKEYKKLYVKCSKLWDFSMSSKYHKLDPLQQHLLDKQLDAMYEYKKYLYLRLISWGIEPWRLEE